MASESLAGNVGMSLVGLVLIFPAMMIFGVLAALSASIPAVMGVVGMTFVCYFVGVCVVLFVLALLFPRFSRRPQRGMDHALEQGGQVGGRAPGPLPVPDPPTCYLRTGWNYPAL